MASSAAAADTVDDRIATAERFFRGVYACDASVVDECAGDNVVVTYPIFETLFHTPVIRGRTAVREFAEGFCQRWADPHIVIHEAVGDLDAVVLVWSFRGRNVGSARADTQPTGEEHSWGGITFFRFDQHGRIVAEIGEESEPGPIERVNNSPDAQ